MSVKISIIVPVYNTEKYIRRCINSLIRQTLDEIKIILVNDGSADGSGTVCEEYAERDGRIRVIHKENAGQGLARNDGLAEAEGRYVCFLDSDDYLEPNACEELYNLMESVGADMASFGYEIDNPQGKVVRVPKLLDNIYRDNKGREDFVLHFFGDDPEDDNLRGFSACMSCFSLDIIRKHGIKFPSERRFLSEDTVFCLEFCKYARCMVTTSKIYYHYCQNNLSFSQGYMRDKMAKTMDMQGVLKEYAKELGLTDNPRLEVRRGVCVRLSMYVWVNLMSVLKQEVRRAETAKENIRTLCDSFEIRSAICSLRREALPLKQKILLYAFLNRWVGIVAVLCGIRAKQRL